MAARTIYFGRFISAPKPEELLIQTGAVLVSSRDGRGVIEKVDWTVNGPNDALSKFGIEAPVVTAHDNGFFFPGFIGKSPSLVLSNHRSWRQQIYTQIHISMHRNIRTLGSSVNLRC